MGTKSTMPPAFDKTQRMSNPWWTPFLSKRILAALVVVIFGGGGIAALDVATTQDVQKAIGQNNFQLRIEDDSRYTKINDVVETQGRDISKIKVKVGDIQNVQQRQIARQEARRLTAGIKNRKEREQAYDLLLEFNLRRLTTGRDPCASLKCDN